MGEKERTWIDIVLGLYPQLPLSNGVIRHTDENDKKRKRILDYLNKIDEYKQLCFKQKGLRFEKIYKTIFYYRNYVIKRENIPESYYMAQNSDEERVLLADKAIADQKKSLDPWIDYFTFGNGRFYPIYEQFWVFQGLTKLGKYLPESKTFSKRNKNTVYPYPYLDEAALEMAIDLMERYVENGSMVQGLNDAYHSYNFKSLYEYSLAKVQEQNNYKTNEGMWITFERGSDYSMLYDMLRGKHTGWCTDRISWLEKYLSKSDFHIFFTMDKDGNYTFPRLVIRTDGQNIVEIRGVGAFQNIESDLVDILYQKMREFNFDEFDFKRYMDVKKLSDVQRKIQRGEELDKNDLSYIYEIDEMIEGFGRRVDPAISEIISLRVVRDDLAKIFSVDQENVALSCDEVTNDTKVFYGDLSYEFIDGKFWLSSGYDDEESIELNELIVPDVVVGDFYANNYIDKLPTLVTKNFDMRCQKREHKLDLKSNIGGSLSVYGLKIADEINLPDRVGYDISFSDLSICEKMKFPESIMGTLNLSRITFCNGWDLPKKVGQSVYLDCLMRAEDLVMPEMIGGSLYLNNLLSVDNITFPLEVNGEIYSLNFPELNKKNGMVR